MTKLLPLVLLSAVLALALGNGQEKIQPSLKKSLRANLFANVFVAIKDGSTYPVLAKVRSDFAARSVAPTHTERTTAVFTALDEFARTSQKPVLDFMSTNFPSVELKSFWSINQVYLKNVDASIVEALAAQDFVAEITEEEVTHISNVYSGPDGPSTEGFQSPMERGIGGGILAEWSLENMRVPLVWNMEGGNMGEGLIIGNIDTGVRGTHELLRDKWVGLENNGWLDPMNHRPDPHDVYNHGTHTMGSLVGGNGIGSAPAAKWLACKGYRDNGSGVASEFIACIQFMVCPRDYSGNNPDCTKSPHVVSNSWGWNGGATIFNPALAAWNAAGIVSSFSAGNAGPTCVSIYSPADQPGQLAVGATDSSNALASFSSTGPSPYDDLKPEISAPGVGVYSASSASDTAYMSASGTSMSCPNASGVLALLKNRDRNLSQERATQLLKSTSIQNVPTTGRTCGGIPDTTWPNNHIGHGKIDAFAAMTALIGGNAK
jgi:subtilisin family serine protease